ncbi:hypothetical protein [Actomonas aquatica]|uniref:HEAT repeat domain-containing protein n=1 Tax=Actomonas aquatica TaxID=2866162 RepID=A0ABZ1C3A2_9BACT|nr:hypothetical protein [Opitutus sp. WL0086]WRQ85921.1 hypothetical protein K1X11_013995 [Opitutus sp. WL0086]
MAQTRSREWLQHYFQNPQPERFVPAMYELSRTDYFGLPGHAMIGIGFVASLFRDNPDLIDEWLLYCRDLPVREARIVVAALWYSEYPKANEWLRLYASAVKNDDLRADLFRIADHPPSWSNQLADSRPALYLQWGRFLATGDEAVLHKIFETMPQVDDLSLRDRWWLACKMAEQDAAISWCLDHWDQQPLEVQANMELVLQAAGDAVAE